MINVSFIGLTEDVGWFVDDVVALAVDGGVTRAAVTGVPTEIGTHNIKNAQ